MVRNKLKKPNHVNEYLLIKVDLPDPLGPNKKNFLLVLWKNRIAILIIPSFFELEIQKKIIYLVAISKDGL